jgi:hypothetical protein
MKEPGDRIVENRIMQCAADIVRALNSAKQINILSLSEYIGESSVLTYQALGWLACKGKVRYRRKAKQVLVALQEGKAEVAGPSE